VSALSSHPDLGQGPALPHHTSLREHLTERAEGGHHVDFQPSNDAPLLEFAQIFEGTTWFSFDVNKYIPADEWSPLLELTVEIVRTAGAEPETFALNWAPVQPGRPLREGFRQGQDSAVWGSTPSDTEPEDERMAAMLLLATTNYVHLSASREQTPPLVRGAIEERGELYKYVVLESPPPIGI
jgi:hypothetical protein